MGWGFGHIWEELCSFTTERSITFVDARLVGTLSNEPHNCPQHPPSSSSSSFCQIPFFFFPLPPSNTCKVSEGFRRD